MRKYLCFVCVAHGQQTHPERSTPTAPFNICPICHLAICSAHSATLCRDGHERESEFQADQRSQADHARNSGCQNVQKIGAAQEDELNDLDVDATTRLGEQIRGFKIVEEGTIAWDMKPLQPVPWWAAKLRAEMERSLDQFETVRPLRRPRDRAKSTKESLLFEAWASSFPDMGNVRHSER